MSHNTSLPPTLQLLLQTIRREPLPRNHRHLLTLIELLKTFSEASLILLLFSITNSRVFLRLSSIIHNRHHLPQSRVSLTPIFLINNLLLMVLAILTSVFSGNSLTKYLSQLLQDANLPVLNISQSQLDRNRFANR